jgi:2,3-bisphosphoglycerate-independent phosphoglycerate mutase
MILLIIRSRSRGSSVWHHWPGARLRFEAAADVLVSLLASRDFVLYEDVLTDLIAHRGTLEQRFEQARLAEELIDATLAAVDLARHRVVTVSDHGNLEEAGHDRHTRNPVPVLLD